MSQDHNSILPCAQCVELMAQPRFQPVVLGLLYHVSIDDKYKGLFLVLTTSLKPKP